MDAVKIKQAELLWSFADNLRNITYRFSSEVSRIANETHDTRSQGLNMVDRVAVALEMAERETMYAERNYSSYVSGRNEDYDPSYASYLKELVQLAREHEETVRRDLERIRILMENLNNYCSTLYSELTSVGDGIRSMADSAHHKILTEHTIITDYNAI